MIATEQELRVVKRNGSQEQLRLSKLHKMVMSACEGLSGVFPSQIEMKSSIQFYDGMSTDEIQKILIKSAVDLISLENPNYQYAAARLLLFSIRKQVWMSETPPHVLELVKRNIAKGVYDQQLVDTYSQEEWEKINGFIKHERDLNFVHAGLKQCVDKYLVQDRITGELYETPQFMYVLIAACLFGGYPVESRLKYVKDYYDIISQHKISLPTPIIAGVRTPLRQFASCILFDMDDNLNSIIHTQAAMGYYVAQRAGIGMNMGRIRGKGAKIRGGEVEHTGIIPLARNVQTVAHSFTQNGLRGGAVTVHFPFFHWEIEDIVQLKNNQGSEETSVRHVDYSIGLSRLVYERYVRNETITLFSNEQTPGLYESFGHPEFDDLYQHYEQMPGIRKKQLPARDFVHTLLNERAETGRIYIYNADHCNSHSHTKLHVAMSNLCQEILLPVKPINHIDDDQGRVATCILSSINLGAVKEYEMEKVCDLTVRALDELIDYQGYPIQAAESYTKEQRTLGIGVINLAYVFAKNKISWDSEQALHLAHQMMENVQYNCIKASVSLAKEKGRAPAFDTSKYSDGRLPIDTYNRNVDELVSQGFVLEHDWDQLREQVLEYGMRNCCLTAIAPTESSSIVCYATSGIDPIREHLTIRRSKRGDLKTISPEYSKYKNYYEKLWDMKSNQGYLQVMAVLQKFVDQSISTNTSYNPANWGDKGVPMSELVKDLFLAYRLGLKTLYYHNTNDGNENDADTQADSGCDSGACKI